MFLGNNLFQRKIITTERSINIDSFNAENIAPFGGNLNFAAYKRPQFNKAILDNFGNSIILVNWKNSGNNTLSFIVWNGTLTMPTHTGMTSAVGEMYMDSGSIEYDPINDLIHASYVGASLDRIVYRRYSIVRDVNNNIVEFSRNLASHNIRLDFANGLPIEYSEPVVKLLNGYINIFWSVRRDDKIELRSSRCELTYTNDDYLFASWEPLITNSTTTISQTPDVQYTALITSSGTTKVSMFSIYISNSELYIAYTLSISNMVLYAKKYSIAANVFSEIVGQTLIGTISIPANDLVDPNKHIRLGNLVFKNELYIGLTIWDTTESWVIFKFDTNIENVLKIPIYSADISHTSVNDFIVGDVIVINSTVTTLYTTLPSKELRCAILQNDIITQDELVYNTLPFGYFGLNILNDESFLIYGRNFNIESINNPPQYIEPFNNYLGVIEII